MLVPSLQIQEQSWDGGRAQELWDPDRVSMPAAETPAQAQDTVHLQEQLLMLTESQSSFPSTLQVPEVPVPLRKQLEAQESHPRLHEEMAEYWRTRWHQVAVALKFKEEELQRLQRQSGTWPPQGRPQQRPQARLQSLQREGAVGPQVCQGTGVCSVDSTRGQWGVGPAAGVSTKGCSTRRTGASSHLHFTAPESLSLWIQSWVLSRTGPVGPLLGSLDLEQKSSSRTGLDTQNLGTVNCPVIHLVKKAGFK
ncbi:PREDICTED: uncharacterized protein LOC105600064 isoform X5 [Cercocebus atys]|uniref:uncharacterized protein LOC105600064 isoform X5 n=1 Tax=Cercocebus atys TaxID=9531 RepID=UPI0005F3DB47|nr:PREDICTED: uncharacterized protein LOC105600064 isoform X5 [Cercocebus atys]